MAKAATKKVEAKKPAGGGSKEVATTNKKTAVASKVDIELLMEQDAGKGVSTDMADNVIPLLKVVQSLSPVALKQKPEYVKGAEAGRIIARGEKVTWDGEKEGIRVVPCYYERIWLEWGPARGDGLRGRHPKGTDNTPNELGAVQKPNDQGKMRWVLPNGNVLQDNRQHVVLLLDKYDDPTPFVIGMAGSNISTSRNWHPMMNKKKTPKGRKAASFSHVYELTTVARSNDDGDWFMWEVSDLDEQVTPEVYLLARQIEADFSGGKLVADVENPESETNNDDNDM